MPERNSSGPSARISKKNFKRDKCHDTVIIVVVKGLVIPLIDVSRIFSFCFKIYSLILKSVSQKGIFSIKFNSLGVHLHEGYTVIK